MLGFKWCFNTKGWLKGRLISLLSLYLFSAAVSAEAPPAATIDETQLRVFVSVLPQQYFAERVGGEQVSVNALVQPGFSPELYEPTARQIAALARADLYVRIGMPFEQAWMPRVQAVNRAMKVIDARDGMVLRTMEAHDHAPLEGQRRFSPPVNTSLLKLHENQLDPHIWTSPRIAKQMAAQLAETFSELRPAHAKTFAANYTQLATELAQLDAELTERFAKTDQRQFMVFHPAWGYFADAYNLTQVPIEFEGKEPSARALTVLIEQAQREQVKTIFVQPQFSQRAAEQVAKAIGGQVKAVDPLALNYMENLREVADLIAGELDETVSDSHRESAPAD